MIWLRILVLYVSCRLFYYQDYLLLVVFLGCFLWVQKDWVEEEMVEEEEDWRE